MTNWRRLFAAVAFIALQLPGCLTVHAEAGPETRAASVLFKQYETVVYTNASLLSDLNARDFTKDVDSLANLKLPFIELLGGLKALGPNTEKDVEKSYSAFLVGAKNFVGPEGLGMFHSRTCYIGVLEGATQSALEPDFRKASYEFIGGRRVWIWSISPDEGYSKPTKFYAAQIAGLYFVMTNNREDFEEAANALTVAENSKPASISVSGLETFRTHKYWAYRLIRRSGIINSDTAGIRNPTPEVVALTFFADVDQRESFIQVISPDKAMKTIPKVVPE